MGSDFKKRGMKKEKRQGDRSDGSVAYFLRRFFNGTAEISISPKRRQESS